MRCPQCRKKLHPDDIYCIRCSASRRFPELICTARRL